MLSRNLIKANQVVLKEKDIRVIDTNELVAEKIKNLHNQAGEESASDASGSYAAIKNQAALQSAKWPDSGKNL